MKKLVLLLGLVVSMNAFGQMSADGTVEYTLNVGGGVSIGIG